jgi:hypothetical protein
MNCCEAWRRKEGRKEGTLLKMLIRDMEHFGSRDVDEMIIL